MLKSLMAIRNWCWRDGEFCPNPRAEDILSDAPHRFEGQFALAAVDQRNDRIRLLRDRLGINKLFYAVESSGRVLASNYIIDLVADGIPVDEIYSVPAGYMLDIEPGAGRLVARRYFEVRLTDSEIEDGLEAHAARIRGDLDRWFAELANQCRSRKVCVCVSGGLDSGLIAALASHYFAKVTFYTYGFVSDGGRRTDDAVYGERLAAFLDRPCRCVPAGATEVLGAIDRALVYGQDWRDFNVHCAIVNELLARAIRQDWIESGEDTAPLVLTGDLMNEFLADYTAVDYGGREYYRLPRLSSDALRAVLIKGLDAGDREVGVFGRHGLDVVQPYGFLVERFLKLPARLVAGENSKQKLMQAVGGDLLPAWIFERTKVRAQIGNAKEPAGVLPLLHEAGYDAKWLQARFAHSLGIENGLPLNDLIRAGRYRSTAGFPTRRTAHGAVT